MSESRRVVLTNTLYAGLGMYAEYAAALISSIVIARQLGPETYGTYTLLVWLTSVGVIVSNHGLTTGVMKFVGEARGRGSLERARGVLLSFERWQLRSSLAICGVSAVLIAFFDERVVVDAEARPLLWILLAAVVLRSLYLYYFSAAKGFEDFRLASLVQASVAPIGLAIVVGVASLDSSVRSFVYAYTFLCLLSAAAMRFGLLRTWGSHGRPARTEARDPRIQRHVLYASAIVILDLLVLRQTELLFLDRFSTRENVAYYGLGRSLAATAMLLIPGVVTALLLPLMARTYGANPGRLRDRFLATTRYIFLLTVPVVVLCEIFAADVITSLYGVEYGPAVLVFRVAVAAGAVGVISSSASSYQLGTDRHSAIVTIMATVAAVTLLLDYVLIRAYALGGAIVAGAAGAILLGGSLLWHAYHNLHAEFDWYTCIRIMAAGALSAIPTAFARQWLPLPLALPTGAILLVALYSAVTIVFGAWTRDDLRSIRALTVRMPRGLRGPAAAFMNWAERFGVAPAGH